MAVTVAQGTTAAAFTRRKMEAHGETPPAAPAARASVSLQFVSVLQQQERLCLRGPSEQRKPLR